MNTRHHIPTRKTKVVYHGTVHTFDRLDHDRSGLGTHFGSRKAARFRASALHRHGRGEHFEIGKYIISFWRPLKLPDIGGWDTLPAVENALRGGQPFGGSWPKILSNEDYVRCRELPAEGASWAFLREKIEAAGYDAVVYENKVEGGESYIIWRDEQIERIG